MTLADDGTRFRTSKVRAIGDDAPPGSFESYSSVYGVNFRVGPKVFEQMAPGSLASANEQKVPVFYQHGGPVDQRWMFPPMGAATENASDDKGLRNRGQMFVEEGGPDVARVYRSMQLGTLSEWSIGYMPTKVRTEKTQGGTLEIVEEASLREISVVVRGANPATETIAVRSAISDAIGALAAREDFDSIVARSMAALDVYVATRGAQVPAKTRPAARAKQSALGEDELVRTFRLVSKGVLSEAQAVKAVLHRAGMYMPGPYTAQPDETIECPDCGRMNDTDASYCDQCGSRLVGMFIAP